MRKWIFGALVLFVCAAASPARAGEEKEKSDRPGLLHRILLYIPNRILDTFDLVRCRVRVGPGVGIGLRATEAADFFVGGYGSVFAGLPGPRYPGKFRLPVGMEVYGGAEFSLIDLTNENLGGPDYSPTEIGASLHLLLVGADVGFDPVEILDWLAGFLTIDVRGDDL